MYDFLPRIASKDDQMGERGEEGRRFTDGKPERAQEGGRRKGREGGTSNRKGRRCLPPPSSPLYKAAAAAVVRAKSSSNWRAKKAAFLFPLPLR